MLALPLCLSVSFIIRQNILQRQRHERFEKEHLQTISISAEKIIWIKPGKEILHEGKLFDVEHFAASGSLIVLSGFYDSKEDKLIAGLEAISNSKKDSTSPINQLMFSVKYNEVHTFLMDGNWQFITRLFPVFTEAISTPSYPATAPPPKFC